MTHVAIIGNGVAGVSAAIRLRERRPDWRISILSGESTHHYSRPALMYIYMGHMRYRDTKPFEDSFWGEQRLELVRDWVTEIDTANKRLTLLRGEALAYDKLLIATGSKPNRFGWPGQELDGVHGLWGLDDLRDIVETTKRTTQAVMVGGGLIGIELAEMLHSRGIPVSFLVREASYWDNILPPEESQMVTRAIREAHIDLRLETNLAEIEGDGQGRVQAVRTEGGERIACQFVGLTPGVSPNIDLARESGIEVGRGILVDWSLRTSAPEVYAAGDCAELVNEGEPRNTIQQVWYTGKRQGQLVADVMAGDERVYDPGIWYNSAKFLDLEYQTYGQVGNVPGPGEQSLYWEHEGGRHALRIVYIEGRVVGFNAMGIRYRHEVCERWIAEQCAVAQVVDDLAQANFDPEFFTRHESTIRAAFQEQLR